mmetsp:Transcript_18785/g.40886  ORF Transcript_18785/g.40886 Transcript_18785/m.40886 type:complete len:313 (-) Transcript_18785:322-1260(-)
MNSSLFTRTGFWGQTFVSLPQSQLYPFSVLLRRQRPLDHGLISSKPSFRLGIGVFLNEALKHGPLHKDYSKRNRQGQSASALVLLVFVIAIVIVFVIVSLNDPLVFDAKTISHGNALSNSRHVFQYRSAPTISFQRLPAECFRLGGPNHTSQTVDGMDVLDFTFQFRYTVVILVVHFLHRFSPPRIELHVSIPDFFELVTCERKGGIVREKQIEPIVQGAIHELGCFHCDLPFLVFLLCCGGKPQLFGSIVFCHFFGDATNLTIHFIQPHGSIYFISRMGKPGNRGKRRIPIHICIFIYTRSESHLNVLARD